MIQAINFNHPESSIMSINDNVIFRYNGIDWVKNDDIKLYRYVNVKLEDLGLNPNDYSFNDYFEFSTPYNNNCIQSELLSDYHWSKKNVSVSTSPDFFSFPNNRNPAFLIRVNNTDTPSSYFIGQEFQSKLKKHYMFSMFIKNITSTDHSKIAISIKDASYNVILTASVDLSEIEWDNNKASLDDNILLLDGTTFEQRPEEISQYFSNTSAQIERILKDEEYYYRISLGFKINNYTIIHAGLHLLDDDGNYLYTASTSSIRFYTSGGQMEINDYKISDTAPYMLTYSKPVYHIITTALYGIKLVNYTKQFALLTNNKIHFIESYTESNNKGIRKMLSSEPIIKDRYDGDIAVVQCVINFGSTSLNIKKQYDKWTSRTYYKIGDYVTYLNNLYKCRIAHTSPVHFIDSISNWEIIVDGVGVGFMRNDSLPNNCIYYDSDENVYRIKKTTTEGDQWLALGYQGKQVRRRAMIKAMLFGQNEFETWDEQSYIYPEYNTGYNTGGNYNFFKLKKISSVL